MPELLYSRYLYAQLSRDAKDCAEVKLNYLDSFNDANLRLTIALSNLSVIQAEVETNRNPKPDEHTPNTVMLPALTGFIMDFNTSGRDIARMAAEIDHPLAADFLFETVKTVLQCEGYFHQERGFPTLKDYDRFYDELLAGSCPFYSLVEKNYSWANDPMAAKRGGNLFTRYRHCSISRLNDHELSVRSMLMDTFHEIAVVLKVHSSTYQVLEVAGSIRRSPDPTVCRSSLRYLENLQHTNLTPENKKPINVRLTGTGNCVHLKDLVSDVLRGLEQIQAGYLKNF